jgi:hypothetical protein
MSGLLSFGGTALEASALYAQGQAAAEIAKFNAETQRQQGLAVERQTRAQSKRQIRSIRTGIAKSGVTFEGTPTMVLAESAANAEIDALNARWTAQRQTAITEFEGRSRQQAARLQAGAALIKGAARLL